MAFLRVILIIVLVYFLIRFLDRHVVPFLFGSPEDKKPPKPPPTGSKQFHKKTSRGEVTITDYGKKKDAPPPGDDYVDFEEVEE